MKDYNKKDDKNEHSKVAMIFLGNKGVGKSALLNQLGGSFDSRFSFVEGVTTDVDEQMVDINGEQVILMDTPGLYEVADDMTQLNSDKLTEALKRGYYYKLFFVVASSSRCITSEDLAFMARVNEAIRKADQAKVEFWVVVNQIRSDEELRDYQENMTLNNLKTCFSQLTEKVKTLSFDIHIKDILLLRYDRVAIENRGFYHDLSLKVLGHEPVRLRVNAIKTRPSDVKDVKEGMSGATIGAIFLGGVAVGGTALGVSGVILRNPTLVANVVKTVGTAGAFVVKQLLGR